MNPRPSIATSVYTVRFSLWLFFLALLKGRRFHVEIETSIFTTQRYEADTKSLIVTNNVTARLLKAFVGPVVNPGSGDLVETVSTPFNPISQAIAPETRH